MPVKRGRMGISGALAGAVNGLFGGGGGMVLAPLLESWCRVEEKRALANCVATILLRHHPEIGWCLKGIM